MTKSELITLLATKQPHLLPKDIDLAVNNIIDTMIATLVNGNRIEVRGFGAFSTVDRKACLGRNPKTGDAVSLPKRRSIHFKAGLDMREKVDASRLVFPKIKD